MDKNANILIVDDNPDIREYLTDIILNIGYKPYTASSGEEALKMLSLHKQIDLILLDVIMPEMNGFDVLRSIRDNFEYDETRIIMVTALQHIDDKELAFRLGASDYLEKPFDVRELTARVNTHIGLKKVTENYIKQKNFLNTILTTIPGIVYLKDNNFRYIHANEQFFSFFDLQSDLVIGSTDLDLFSSDVTKERQKSDDLIINFGIRELEFVEDVPFKDGDLKHLLTRKRPVFDSDGNCSGLVSISIDITEQIALKEAYFEQENLLRAVIDNIPFELWALDNNHIFLLQNKFHFTRWGNVIGKSIEEMEIPDPIKEEWINSADMVNKGETYFNQYSRKEDDVLHWYVKEIRPIESENCIIGSFGMKRDITKEHQLKNSFENVCNTIPDILEFVSDPIIFISMASGIPVWKNKTAMNLLFTKKMEIGSMRIKTEYDGDKVTIFSDGEEIKGFTAGTIYWNNENVRIVIINPECAENHHKSV